MGEENKCCECMKCQATDLLMLCFATNKHVNLDLPGSASASTISFFSIQEKVEDKRALRSAFEIFLLEKFTSF